MKIIIFLYIFRSCLANDPVCSDDFFQWLLVQVHTKDQHAITIDGFRLIYNEKLPNLRPETISMLGLNLFSQLCQLSRMRRPSTVSTEYIVKKKFFLKDNLGGLEIVLLQLLHFYCN